MVTNTGAVEEGEYKLRSIRLLENRYSGTFVLERKLRSEKSKRKECWDLEISGKENETNDAREAI